MTRSETVIAVQAFIDKHTLLLMKKDAYGLGEPKMTWRDMFAAFTYLQVISDVVRFGELSSQNQYKVLKNAHKYS